MMNRLYITCLVAALLLVGCTKDTTPTEPTQPQPMRFAAFLQEGDDIRPLNSASNTASRTIDGTIDNGFYLYVSQLNASNYICDNMKVAANGTLSTPSFWLQGVSDYRIEAYAVPSGTKFPKTINTDWVFLKHEVANDPALQEDLLTASFNILTVTYDKPLVNLYFHHALSRLVFKLQRTMAGPSIYDVSFKITYVANKVRKSANVYLIQFYEASASPTYHAGTFPLGVPFNHSSGETQPVTIGDIIIVPQTIPKGGLTIEMSYKLDPAAGARVRMILSWVTSRSK